MAERTCFNCIYCICDPCLWLRWIWAGESIVPQCANHPQWPGELHDVPGVPCRSYRPKPAVPQGPGVRLIPLGDGGYTYVDAADYDRLKQWKWHLCSSGYAARYEGRKTIYMHREILPPPKGKVTDHRDGNKANNCRCNLRPATRAQNCHNQRKHNGSRSIYKGVFYNKEKHKWYAVCWPKGRRRKLGYFDTEVEAARAYDRVAVEWFGEFARLNFPQEWPPQRRAEVCAQRQELEEQGRSEKAKGKGRKGKGRSKKAKVKRKKGKSKGTSPRGGTRGRRGRKRTTKSARAPAAKSGRKGKT